MQTSTESRNILSVSELNQQLKQLIHSNFPLLWVEGEISNLAQPASGHVYFSLKDNKANIRCVMFRTSVQKINFPIVNGTQVIVRARASLYEPRGDLQLIAEDMEEAGFGALQKQFEQLKNKLFKEGLFDEQRKQAIPDFPKHVAIVSSPSAAAVKDYLKVISRRYPCLKKTIYAAPVQGEQAASKLCEAIQAANQHATADVIVLIRGGGSIEDLWPFNDEQLARSIANSSIPIVSGIGHEIDYTIADFVADLRAPTPSIAAELTTPDIHSLQIAIKNTQTAILRLWNESLVRKNQQTDWLSRRLQQTHPSTTIAAQNRSLKALGRRMQLIHEELTKYARSNLNYLHKRLENCSPEKFITQGKTKTQFRQTQLLSAMRKQIDQHQHRFELLTNTLQAISPLGTLERGYSITGKQTAAKQPVLLHSYHELKSGDQLITYLAEGHVMSRVQSTSSENYIETIQSSKKNK